MTVRYTADVFCDMCGNWMHGVTSAKNTGLAKQALAKAKRQGWSRSTRSVYTDLCPECLSKVRQTGEPHAS